MSNNTEITEIRGASIINDTSEATPEAMRASLATLGELSTTGRRIVVCGDLAVTGRDATAVHWRLGREIVQLGRAELLIACGQFARHITGGARAAGLVRTRAIPCDTVEEALPYLGQAVQPGDVVLLKAPQMFGIERVVAALATYPQRRSA